MKVLITGASGFIGSHLAEKLLGQGYEVACLKRKTSDTKWLEGLNIKFIPGDCCDKGSLNDYIKDYDYILHLSGLTKANSKRDFYMVNEKGTENIIEAVSRYNSGIKRFIYLSSLSAFGPMVNKNLPSENSKPHPVSDYGKSKLMGENAVLKYRNRVPISILRPTVVYGPRDRQLFLLFKLIKKGILPYWGDGYISLIYIDDLIDAIILTMQREDAVGKTYFISDGKVYSNNEVLNEIASALDVRVFKIRLPKPVLPLIGFLGDGIGKITGKSTMINRDKMKELVHTHWVCDISKARDELGFEPKVGIKKGIKWTVDWYKIHRWL
jgi:nucleoside-diphosphate-sugar epimerase